MEIDGLAPLIADLTEAPRRVRSKVDGVVRKGAVNMVRDWQQRASGLAHAPRYPDSIGFSAGWKGAGYEAEIGPDKLLPQGALGNLITFGSVHNPPSGDDVAVADAEAPRFEKAIADLAGGAL